MSDIKPDLRAGMVIQINPESSDTFGGCFMIITEPKIWGAQGYVQVPGIYEGEGGQAFYRCEHEDMSVIGNATWIIE